MANRPTERQRSLRLEYQFDRLSAEKLAQAYEVLAPDQVRPTRPDACCSARHQEVLTDEIGGIGTREYRPIARRRITPSLASWRHWWSMPRVTAMSINAIARMLNERQIPTRTGTTRWERSTVWGVLRNPAYCGRACYGKTELRPRQRITRPLRQRNGIATRNSANHERPRQDWIEIAVPALIMVLVARWFLRETIA